MKENNEIVEKILKSGMLHILLKNMCIPEEWQDDLLQELCIILLEYDNEKMNYMYDNKQLKFFCVRVIQSQYYSAHSPFFKKYKKYYTLIDGNALLQNDNEDDTDERGFEE